MWSVATGVGGAAPTAYAAGVAPSGMNAAAMSASRMVEDLGYVVGPIALGFASAGVWTWRFNWRPLPKRWIAVTVPVWQAGRPTARAMSA